MTDLAAHAPMSYAKVRYFRDVVLPEIAAEYEDVLISIYATHEAMQGATGRREGRNVDGSHGKAVGGLPASEGMTTGAFVGGYRDGTFGFCQLRIGRKRILLRWLV